MGIGIGFYSYSVHHFNDYNDDIVKCQGIIYASSYADAMEKLEDIYDIDRVNMLFQMNDCQVLEFEDELMDKINREDFWY